MFQNVVLNVANIKNGTANAAPLNSPAKLMTLIIYSPAPAPSNMYGWHRWVD
jgi:hypothetical protein